MHHPTWADVGYVVMCFFIFFRYRLPDLVLKCSPTSTAAASRSYKKLLLPPIGNNCRQFCTSLVQSLY
jgi:hypothetical protein